MKKWFFFGFAICLLLSTALAEPPVTECELSSTCQSRLSFNAMYGVLSEYKDCSVERIASMFDDAEIPYRGSTRVCLNDGEIEIGRIGNYFGLVGIEYCGIGMPLDLPWDMSIDTAASEFISELKEHSFSGNYVCENADTCLYKTTEIKDSCSYTVIVTGPLEDTIVSFVYRVYIHENSVKSITLKLIDGEYTVDDPSSNMNSSHNEGS